ncbi:MAG: PilZ domain-containing protein [Pseudomonadota bacterium]|nr:PilZ domain-containing protein [Pseudomonadota bacterium]MBU1399151.1 PilZ domain-containing protein [Pseudomonadota bacterium]MBU1569837.1 PilZ domain-containing protein [Pseudomonadota bacterium]
MSYPGNRRRKERVYVKWPVTIIMSSGIIEGETTNISAEGLGIVCDEPLHLETSYTLRIKPVNHGALEVTGKVMWSDLYGIDGDNKMVGIGICFIEISEKDRLFFNEVMSGNLK